ncbi:hypothetical protein BCF44_14119 [Kutzneria buriramensis]|uniref:Uncharacterized protein n=1 Tax=Kutzneria buriramensis TaxID=1045776 RepID=A0A3E0G528_9PSEU|nr:hypothetical protein BCF44_14119 [Kutzneria buriramensis]
MRASRAAAVTIGVAALLVTGAGVGVADTVVQVGVPVDAHSLYVYQGSGPEGDSNWSHCFPISGMGIKTPSIPATPGQSHTARPFAGMAARGPAAPSRSTASTG